MKRAKTRKKAGESLHPAAVALALVLVFGILFHDRIVDRVYALRHTAPAIASPDNAQLQFDAGTYFLNTRSSNYDLGRAEKYLKRAVRANPSFPYVHHELARVYFLNGDFDAAELHATIEIQNHGDESPRAYYVRGLVRGFQGDYEGAVFDYAQYLKFDPHNWAAINDYAWVLLKSEHFEEAIIASARGLQFFPDNAWLLSTNSVALAEQGYAGPARAQAEAAVVAAQKVTEEEWLKAYPGNDPRIASDGVAALRSATELNAQMLR